MSKILQELDSLYDGKVDFGSVDADLAEMREIYLNARVSNVPALIYYWNGGHVETKMGLEPREKIEQRIKLLLSNCGRKDADVQI